MTTVPGTRRLLPAAALAGVLTIALTACSGSAASPSTADPANQGGTASDSVAAVAPAASTDTSGGADDADPVCALVTKDDVATAVGYPIATALGAGGTCIFQNTDPSKYFGVQLFDTSDGMAPYLSVEASAQHVAGLGDDAFWQPTAGFLFVRKGDQAILFLDQAWIMTPDTDTARRDSLVTLARTALQKL